MTSGEFEAAQVLITLSLGALKAVSVCFVPELPAAKREAIGRLSIGTLNKCYLKFPEAFWDEDADWLEYLRQTRSAWTE